MASHNESAIVPRWDGTATVGVEPTSRFDPSSRSVGTYSPRSPVSRRVFLDLVRLADLVTIGSASLTAFRVYGVGVVNMSFAWPQTLLATIVGIVLSALILNHMQLYRIKNLRHLSYQIPRVSLAWALSVGCMIILAGLAKISDNYSRGWLLLWWSSAGGGLIIVRILAFRILQVWVHDGKLRTPVAIVGAGQPGQRVARRLISTGHDDAAIVGMFDDRLTRLSHGPEDMQPSGTVADLIEAARSHAFDKVIIALPLNAERRIVEIVKALRQLPVQIDLSLDFGDERLVPSRMSQFGGLSVMHLVEKPLRDWHGVGKAIEDFTIASTALILCAPLMLFIAIATRLDTPGPVLFRQTRFGFNNQQIVVYKFRTMHTDLSDPSGKLQTVRGDPRVTRVGQFLRRTNLDELPQFINVLQGRLSVVGPRPHPLSMRAADKIYHEAVDDYANRHRVKPGITGWAQINGLRGETDTMAKATARVAHDLFYIDNWSVLFDLKIVALTMIRGFRDPNAY